MKPWPERPREAAFLLNPAFGGWVVAAATAAYQEEADQPLPYPLSFLVLPIVLHKKTRTSLPRTARTSLAVWITENPEARLGMADRVQALRSHTREAVILGSQSGLIGVLPAGLEAKRNVRQVTAAAERLSGEASECVSRSIFVGRWLARTGDPATAFALWGVRP